MIFPGALNPSTAPNTHLHANDRQGLERLCRYGTRGALALERLKRAEDGRIAYRMKRPLPVRDGPRSGPSAATRC